MKRQLAAAMFPVLAMIMVAATSPAAELTAKLTDGGVVVKIDGEPVTDIKAALSPGRYLCQVGKRKFAYVTVLAPQ